MLVYVKNSLFEFGSA